MPNDAIQETDNREEAARQTRQVGARREEDPAEAWKKSPKWKVLHRPRTRKVTKSAAAAKATPKGRGVKSK